MPAAAICGVKPTNVSVALFSELPVLPPTGRPPRMPATCVGGAAVARPNADCWPTGQRAASVAAAATSAQITCLHVGATDGDLAGRPSR